MMYREAGGALPGDGCVEQLDAQTALARARRLAGLGGWPQAGEALPSVTVTTPRAPMMSVPGAPDPRSAVSGATMSSVPASTANVTAVSSVGAAAAGRAVTVMATATAPPVTTDSEEMPFVNPQFHVC